MQMISTPTPIRAFLGNENLRGELNGKKRKPMVDLKLSAKFDASTLDRMEPGLCALLFREPRADESPDLADRHRPAIVRMPLLEPLRWKKEHIGYQLTIAHGSRGDESALKFEGVKMDGYVVTPEAGGVFLLEWRAAVDPSGQLDRLSTHMHSEIELTMIPPAEEPVQQDIDLAPSKTTGKALDGTK